jgi:hypothetical protein
MQKELGECPPRKAPSLTPSIAKHNNKNLIFFESGTKLHQFEESQHPPCHKVISCNPHITNQSYYSESPELLFPFYIWTYPAQGGRQIAHVGTPVFPSQGGPEPDCLQV